MLMKLLNNVSENISAVFVSFELIKRRSAWGQKDGGTARCDSARVMDGFLKS
jgi:hypothetical protein